MSSSSSRDENFVHVTKAPPDITWPLRAIAANTRGSLVNRGLLLGIGLVAMDALVVGGYQPEVALGIIRWTAPIALLTGSAVNLAPIGLTVAVCFVACRAGARIGGGRLSAAVSDVGAALGLLLIALATTVNNEDGFLIVIACAALAGLCWGSATTLSGRSRLIAGAVAVVAAVVAASTTVGLVTGTTGSDMSALRQGLARPYVPSEELTLVDGKKLIGYVLQDGSDSDWMTILRDADRQITILPKADVTARSVCHPSGSSSPGTPRLAVLPALSGVPTCPASTAP